MSKQGVALTRPYRQRRPRVNLEERHGIAGKVCGGECGEWKPLEDFSKGRAAGGRVSSCKGCRSSYKKQWDRDNREKTQAYHAEHRQERNKQAREWKANNADRDRELKRDWNKRNRQKRRLYDQKRWARLKGLPSDLDEVQAESLVKHFGGCALTGSYDFDMDHVVPISVGHGGTTLSNIIPLRSDLNSSKNNRNVFEWFEYAKDRFQLEQTKFDEVITHLAKLNGMTVEEYRDYVYWCHGSTAVEA